jgi:hypothetical protein
VGARVFFEQNRLQFAGEGNVLTTSGQPVTAARDEYLGVMAHHWLRLPAAPSRSASAEGSQPVAAFSCAARYLSVGNQKLCEQ